MSNAESLKIEIEDRRKKFEELNTALIDMTDKITKLTNDLQYANEKKQKLMIQAEKDNQTLLRARELLLEACLKLEK
jgi:flagellar biosynthesis/type III secretory pathway chaperone